MNKLYHIAFTVLLWGIALGASAQKSFREMGGVYYAYPVTHEAPRIAVPEGYQPFYISHYGRHGSRWLPSDERYEWVVAQFANEENLTKEGLRLKKKLNKVWKNAKGNGGQLTPLGYRQHRDIADRMVACYPEVFSTGAVVSARSSVSNRCRESMLAFTRQLSKRCPTLAIHAVTDSADMAWIAYTSPALSQLQRTATFNKMKGSPDRLMAQLFRDPTLVDDPARLCSELHTIASDMQDVPLPIDLYTIFTEEEFRDVYERNNERMVFLNANDPHTGGIPALSALSLWQQMEREADRVITEGGKAADLRFGHDTNLYRLLALMKASSIDSGCMDEILPMATNLQMVFYRNASGDVLVRMLHNEKDFTLPISPAYDRLYRWTDVKQMMADRIHRLEHLQHLHAVNTMVGTAKATTHSAGVFGKGSEEQGQTLPAVLTPNGQNCWTPQTRDTEEKCVAPYYYTDSLLQGFRNSHWIVGGCTQDYGSATVAALGGILRTSPKKRATRFSHDQEVSHPHYYAVNLPDEHLRVELTASPHGAIMRITPAIDQMVYVVVNPNSDEGQGDVWLDTVRHEVYVSNPVHRIYQGWGESAGFSGHLLLSFSQCPVEGDCSMKNYPHAFYPFLKDMNGAGAWVAFEGKAGEPIEVRMASSFTSLSQCRNNMRAEVEGVSFEEMMERAAEAWIDRFHTIDVTDSDTAAVNQFYGALYRASFLPRLLSDADGSYPRFADGLPMKGNTPRYTDFSMWDTYRALHPLYHIILPTLSGHLMQSLVGMAEEGGWLPIFPCWNSYTAAMIGDHCAVALADAYVKGVRGFDAQRAYQAMRKNAFESPSSVKEYADGMGRRALSSYLKYGFIPMEDGVSEAFHNDEQTSRTMEYAFDDFAVAQMAKALGHDDDYKALMQRSGNWRNIFNPRTGYADGRHQNGRFENNTDFIHRKSYFTEGAACHYTWYVPHDPAGLVQLMGGKHRFVERLDSMFANGLYWHGNEPCHQMAYMFDYADRPDLTRKWVSHILKTEYADTPGGLSGNDDAGQMSAWYVFSAMGFYPVCPATKEYMLGTTMFDSVRVNLENGRTFSIIGRQDMADGQSPMIDGHPLSGHVITHDDLTNGTTLHIKKTR